MNAKKINQNNVEGQFVSRGGLKLASVADKFDLRLAGTCVLDVGSSTGGFSDYALQRGARKIIAVEAGTNQLHPRLHGNPKIELHEQTDIRDISNLTERVDYVFIDVSFISIREVLSHLPKIIDLKCEVIAMVKPQFETNSGDQKHKGIIKNETIRRQILKEFETWVHTRYRVISKADSGVTGDKGNRERFYRLVLLEN